VTQGLQDPAHEAAGVFGLDERKPHADARALHGEHPLDASLSEWSSNQLLYDKPYFFTTEQLSMEPFRRRQPIASLRRLELHYVPTHASWLNMVEIEIGLMRGQCLSRRIG
jgi:hypothetical protein